MDNYVIGCVYTYALLNSPTKQNIGSCFATILGSNADHCVVMQQLYIRIQVVVKKVNNITNDVIISSAGCIIQNWRVKNVWVLGPFLRILAFQVGLAHSDSQPFNYYCIGLHYTCPHPREE